MKNATDPIVVVKRPRHVAAAISHMLKQMEKAGEIRDKAAAVEDDLEAAFLHAFGWEK